MEDYKQKYEQALENFKKIKAANKDNKELVDFIEYQYPELQESEDERIRKEIVEIFKDAQRDGICEPIKNEQFEKIFAWLEKQSNQKPTCQLDNSVSNVSFPFKVKVKSNGKIITIHNGQLNPDGKEWIKYQSDKKDGYKIYEPNNLELVCEIEQNPVWSEEDEKMLNSIIDVLEVTPSARFVPIKREVMIPWLKSLKERYTWKPSEEQMNALKEACDKHWEPDGLHPLYTLWENLKKL